MTREIHLADLTSEESAAFGAILQRTVHADRRLSFQESDVLRELAQQHGLAFWEALEAGARLDDGDLSIGDLAAAVRRPEVRRFAYEVMRAIAACDAVQATEAAVLRELREHWELA